MKKSPCDGHFNGCDFSHLRSRRCQNQASGRRRSHCVADSRTHLITELDVHYAKAPPRFEVKAPKDAPNVVIVLIDDMGFGAAKTFGGPEGV